MRRFSQINFARRSSYSEPVRDPVLTPEDEAYLQRLTAQLDSGDPAPLPDWNLSTTSPVREDAQNTPLPPSPTNEPGEEVNKEGRKPEEKLVSELSSNGVSAQKENRQRPWSRIWRMRPVMGKDEHSVDAIHSRKFSDHGVKRSSTDDNGTNGMSKDMSDILEPLNLSTDNKNVFSVNEETQELLRKFKLIFKDLVNGVPTAYHDLEMLLNDGNNQLQQSYTQLPSFLQRLIKIIPEQLAKSFGLDALAAADKDNTGKAAAAAWEIGLSALSLKEIVGNPKAIVAMLRSIMAFLKTRFPAIIGMNVLWSLALFILLFVLWYCHKRGREVRLDNERLVTEEETRKINEEGGEGGIPASEALTTTAPPGASAEEVREGMKEAQQAREEVPAKSELEHEQNWSSLASVPTRSLSKLATWSKRRQKSVSNIQPYPGT